MNDIETGCAEARELLPDYAGGRLEEGGDHVLADRLLELHGQHGLHDLQGAALDDVPALGLLGDVVGGRFPVVVVVG